MLIHCTSNKERELRIVFLCLKSHNSLTNTHAEIVHMNTCISLKLLKENNCLFIRAGSKNRDFLFGFSCCLCKNRYATKHDNK